MIKRLRFVLTPCLAVVALLPTTPAGAQILTEPAPLTSGVAAVDAAPPLNPSFKRLLKDTATDFTRLPARDSARWLAIGAAASLLGRTEDSNVSSMLARPRWNDTFESGQLIGSLPFQMGGALATYVVGRATGNSRAVQLGADLFRAQAVAQTTTYAMKYTIRRTRPDGTRFSFPSGHTSVTFASATVLQRTLGWKAGVPAYGVAAYVAASRLQTKRHYLSDVAFGAALGILAGRTVTIGHGKTRLAVAPMAAPGGAGVAFTLF